MKDWNFSTKIEYSCLLEIKKLLHDPIMVCSLIEEELDYNLLFNDKVYSMMKTGKPASIIADYVNAFKCMNEAFSENASGDDGNDFSAKDIDKLIEYIKQAIGGLDLFLLSLGMELKNN